MNTEFHGLYYTVLIRVHLWLFKILMTAAKDEHGISWSLLHRVNPCSSVAI